MLMLPTLYNFAGGQHYESGNKKTDGYRGSMWGNINQEVKKISADGKNSDT